MTKPIGYYTDYTTGDNSYLETLIEKYGSRLQKLTLREKLFLVSSLAGQLIDTTTGECRNEIYVVAHQIPKELSTCEIEGLLEALIVQIRWG